MFEIPCTCGSEMKEYLHTVKEPTEVTFFCEECGNIKTIPIAELRSLYAKKVARYKRE